MNDLPLFLYNAKEIKSIEDIAIAKLPISAYALMCRAGEAAFRQLQLNWPQAQRLDIFCGAGNNGGDGFVLARLAKQNGLAVSLYAVGDWRQKKRTQEAMFAQEAWEKMGGGIIPFQGEMPQGDVIVDAILGTGAHGELAPECQQSIEIINACPQPIFAIDLPSGLHADTGNSLGMIVNATITLTFVAMKIGLLCNEAINTVGQLFFEDLGIDQKLYENVPYAAVRLEWNEVINALPHRKLTAHKGDFGHVCVIGGGQSGYSGAVSLSGESALRAGAGLVSAIVAPESLPLLARAPSELMCYGATTAEEVLPIIQKATVLVLGPGLSQTAWGKKFFELGLQVNKSMVVDADGLNWLAHYPQKRNNWILTPHPGEAARLLAKTTQEIQKNRFESARALRDKYGGVIVLKGASTIIIDEDDRITIQPGGFPVLATGGTGDILAGLIGGLLSQKLSLSLAAKIGVSVHANAAKQQQQKGERGMLASDLFLSLRSLINPSSM